MKLVYANEALEVHVAPGRGKDAAVVAVANQPVLEKNHPWHRWAIGAAETFAVIVSRGRHAFPLAPMEGAAAALNVHVRGDARLGLGNSLWGHGLMKHARLLDLTWSIAISPPYSLDPEMSPDSAQLAKSLIRAGVGDFRGSRVDEHGAPTPTRCWTIYDTTDPKERRQSRLVNEVAGVQTIPAHHLGHNVTSLLGDELVLNGLFDAIRADDAPRAARLLRDSKKDKFHYFVGMARRAARHRHWRWARDFLERAEKAGYTTRSMAFDEMMAMHLEFGESDRVEQLLARALDRGLQRPRPYFYGAQLRVRQGRIDEAISLCDLGLARCPGTAILGDLRRSLIA